MRYSLVVAASCLSLLAARPSDANTIQINFAGTVDLVTSSEAGFAASFNTSQTMTGSYSFESTTADADSSPEFGTYQLTSFTITVGSYTAQSTAGALDVVNADAFISHDSYSVTGTLMTGASVAGLQLHPTGSAFYLLDESKTALSSDALPLIAPNLSAFPDSENLNWSVNFFNPGDFTKLGRVRGQVTSLTVQSASVPDAGATLWLLGLGAAGLAAMRRRFQSERS